MDYAARLQNLGTESAFDVLAEVQRLEAAGRDIISFAIGEPDFETPEPIKRAGIDAIARGETHYGPSAGIPALRDAIAEYISATRGIPVTADHVVVTPGAKPIIFHSMLALLEPGDEVIFPTPGFAIYASVARFLGAELVPLPLHEARGFSFDPDELRHLAGPRTKLIVLNSPHNPTGGMLGRADLEAVAEAACRYDAWVLSDEIYSRLVYDGEFMSIAQLPGMQDRTILLDGFSKTYAMTGWRLGYGVMNAELARAVARIETNCESCTATFTQHAGIEALQGSQAPVEAMVREFAARRDLIVAGLGALRGVRCHVPSGAFYVFPNVTEACRQLGCADANAFQRKLLEDVGVAVLPHSAFGPAVDAGGEQYVRFSYATSRKRIETGLARLAYLLGTR